MAEQEDPEIRVHDRRRFTAEGEAKADAPEAAPEQAPSAEAFTPPPARFEILIYSLVMQAEMELGMGPVMPGQEAQPPNLAVAKHSIDMLGVLQEKTKGNLTMEEQRMLENSLTELRFRYVQKVEEIGQSAEEGGAAAS